MYFNDGRGRMLAQPSWRMPISSYTPRAIAAGDLDGDGDVDLVLGNLGSGGGTGNTLLLNKNGWGVFEDMTSGRLPGGSPYTNAVALGDVDGDGELDIVFGNSGAVGQAQNALLLNDGAGTFTASTNLPADSATPRPRS